MIYMLVRYCVSLEISQCARIYGMLNEHPRLKKKKKNPHTKVWTIVSPTSYHKALLLNTNGLEAQPRRYHRLFRFKAIWVKKEDREMVIRRAWREDDLNFLVDCG